MNTNPENPVNPVQDPDSAPLLETGNPKLETPALPAGRPLSRLLDLSERQREHVDTWLKEGVPFRKIVALCQSEFQKEIPYMTFVRYSNRTYSTRQIEELAASKEVAAELRRYAATGDPSFSAPTLEIFEQMAFDLAVAYSRDHDADDLAIIKQLWPLIHRAKNTSVRERHATVQERKCDLRAEELALKREMFHARLNGGLNPNRHPNPNLSPNSRGEIDPTHPCNADNLSAPSRDDIDANTTPAAPYPHYNPNNPVEKPSSHPTDPTSETQNPKFKTQNSASAYVPLTEAEIEALIPRVISPRPLPPEVIRANIIYAEKVRTGKIIIDRSGHYIRAVELPDTAEKIASSEQTQPRESL